MGAEKCFKILDGKPEGRRQVGRPRRGWKDIRLDLREIGWKSVEWMHLAEDRDQ
jgi:hypothetical protein